MRRMLPLTLAELGKAPAADDLLRFGMRPMVRGTRGAAARKYGENGSDPNGTYLSLDSAIAILTSATLLSFPPYFAALHTAYV